MTAEEAELWTYAMRDAHGLRRRELARQAEGSPQADADEPAPAHQAAPAPPAKNAAPIVRHPPYTPPSPPPPKSPPMSSYDEKERRRLGKNPEMIEARLDLHGFRQREAHTALRSFLLSCSARGLRHVLIITGKGTAAVERQRDFYGEERGVLRRLVPQWLSGPELRGMVVSYAASHIRHGGEGALYIRLRKAGSR